MKDTEKRATRTATRLESETPVQKFDKEGNFTMEESKVNMRYERNQAIDDVLGGDPDPTYGKHRVKLINKPILHKAETKVDDYTGEVKTSDPYVELTLQDIDTLEIMTKDMYGIYVESLRANINNEYAGAAGSMAPSQMFEFMREHPVDFWVSWIPGQKKTKAYRDFFDRYTWEMNKRERAKVDPDSIRRSKR